MEPTPLHNPHDHFFEQTLGRPRAAAQFLREFLPPALCSELDWERLQRRESSFVDETLKERHSDLLFTVPWKESKLQIYILFEHQLQEDPLMAFRLLAYMVRIWEHELHGPSRPARLTPILPMVLHQSEGQWRTSRQFAPLIDLPGEGPSSQELTAFIPDFRFSLVDLSEDSLAALRRNVLARAILTTMRLAREKDFLEHLDDLAGILEAALKETDIGFMRVCLEYLLRGGSHVDLDQFRAKLKQLEASEFKKNVMSIANQLIAEGRQEGRQEEAKAILIRQLSRRFGLLPQWALERLDQACVEELEAWSDQIFDASDLETLLGRSG